MKYGKIIIGAACGLTAILAFAGGNPQYVQFPGDYQGSFTNYAMMNRAGSAAVAKMYANDIAIASARKGQPAASGSVIVMEVYKPKKGSDGKPIVGRQACSNCRDGTPHHLAGQLRRKRSRRKVGLRNLQSRWHAKGKQTGLCDLP
jgi:hypothetical protein